MKQLLQTYYLTVWFLRGSHGYTYKTRDKSITVNTVVMVPVGDHGEVKSAIVSGVHTAPPPDIPKERIKAIQGKASREECAKFSDIDMRVPLDISTKAVSVNGEYISVPTTKEEKEALRKKYKDDPNTRIVELSFNGAEKTR